MKQLAFILLLGIFSISLVSCGAETGEGKTTIVDSDLGGDGTPPDIDDPKDEDSIEEPKINDFISTARGNNPPSPILYTK